MTLDNKVNVIVLISADTEWGVVKELFPQVELYLSPFGEWFWINHKDLKLKQDSTSSRPIIRSENVRTIFFHGGWGKIAAAASTQYIIDHWAPLLLINLGTCGGFEGDIEKGTTILVEKTIVYDIIEQMGDYDTHIAQYTTELDLAWLGDNYPQKVSRTLLVSADRDLIAEEIQTLRDKYGAVAGDWESGAIAFVANLNQVPTIILRGVTDLVGSRGGEAYGDMEKYVMATRSILRNLVKHLPNWIELGVQNFEM